MLKHTRNTDLFMSYVFKAFVKIINKRIYGKCEEKSSDTQFGFKNILGSREALYCNYSYKNDQQKDIFICVWTFAAYQSHSSETEVIVHSTERARNKERAQQQMVITISVITITTNTTSLNITPYVWLQRSPSMSISTAIVNQFKSEKVTKQTLIIVNRNSKPHIR